MASLTDLGNIDTWTYTPEVLRVCLGKFPMHKLDFHYDAKTGIETYSCKQCGYKYHSVKKAK